LSFIFAIVFLLPGFLAASVFLERELRVVAISALSLVVYTVMAVAMIRMQISDLIVPVFLFLSVISIGYGIANPKLRKELIFTSKQLLVFLPALALLWLYSVYVGPFVDHGVDLFRHMTDVQDALFHMQKTGGHLLDETKNIGTSNHLIHILSALFAYHFDLSGMELVPRLSFVYSLVWTFTIFFFARFIFATLCPTPIGATLLSYISTIFYWITFGINSFSFPRYYFASPSILAYCGFLTLLSVGLYMYSVGHFSRRLTMLGLAIGTTIFYLHPQELMLACLMFGVISILCVVKSSVGLNWFSDIAQTKDTKRFSVILLAAAFILICVVIAANDRDLATTVRLLNIGPWLPFVETAYILKPSFQFYTVLGWWGMAVYLIAVINGGRIVQSGLLTATLIFPLVTVFNPLFVEAFLRIQNSLTLWRALYALPLPILCTFLGYRLLAESRKMTGLKKSVAYLQVVILGASLIPATEMSLGSPMTRWPSLVKTPVANSYLQWRDLIEFLEPMAQRQDIITDPSTGYVISALTKHKTYTKKFYAVKHGIKFNHDSYDESTFKKRKGWLLVLNQRNGAVNQKLKKPFHVPPDVMLVKEAYDPRLIEFVAANGGILFKELWHSNQISVFRIL
jgi:hypothetical protein